MKRTWLGFALAVSLAVNAGVLVAVGFAAWQRGGPGQATYFGMEHENLPEHLGLSAEQRAKWHAMEEGFLAALTSDAREIGAHREKMIRGSSGGSSVSFSRSARCSPPSSARSSRSTCCARRRSAQHSSGPERFAQHAAAEPAGRRGAIPGRRCDPDQAIRDRSRRPEHPRASSV
jgi:hypothetical protein